MPQKPKFNPFKFQTPFGCAQWTINTLGGLVYPDILEGLLSILFYNIPDGGLVPRGPSGGKLTYVMTGSSFYTFYS